MRIREYEYKDLKWKFSKLSFQKINLIVGDSGTGKTRLLNTIFNLGTSVVHGEAIGECDWDVCVQIEKDIYKWKISTYLEKEKSYVGSESLLINDTQIINRDRESLLFNDEKMPKLPKNQPSIYIFKDEQKISPLYEGFSKILRRRFFSDEQEKNTRLIMLNMKMINDFGKTLDLFELYKMDLPLTPRLLILKRYFPKIYNQIINSFLETFEYVTEAGILENLEINNINIPDNTPIFCIRERNVDKPIRLDELSSGMQKALLIITDYFSLPANSIYLIDEYENSLGIGPINLLPNLLKTYDNDLQIFITSHHPYIITKFPVSNWYITHRIGSNVKFEFGESLDNIYSKSLQDKYFQLINDKNYTEGIG
ncbi:MAG: ATP-binding protein [Dehalobacter sp.]|nr:ATP-binding protein [Dehalobacter sp.]